MFYDNNWNYSCIFKSPFDERAAKFRIAKHGLTVAVLVLGVLNLLQIGIDPGADIKHLPGCIALAVSYFKAMIFTMAVLVLIRPAEVTLKFVIIQVVAIFLWMLFCLHLFSSCS